MQEKIGKPTDSLRLQIFSLVIDRTSRQEISQHVKACDVATSQLHLLGSPEYPTQSVYADNAEIVWQDNL